ncbi:transposase [Mesorhizobium sp.]|uniref:transposase n=1 Tax=Mesorhizobium sp. TaxID=1871066 RepID=UPI000FE887DE|nr:transposase [Mesorhizobium sp.]RWK66551.1 MAG: transposase [Mesorhizobium sp.]
MARALSLDLRKRVVDAIDAGLSTREAARRFSIGISTSGAWYRAWRSNGSLEPGRQGKPRISKLDAHKAFILALVDTDDRDITLAEIAAYLESERGVKASVTTVDAFFAKRGITYKKDGARRRAATSGRSGGAGRMVRRAARSRSRPSDLHRRSRWLSPSSRPF